MSARDFLIRGLLAGLLAAFAAFAVAYVVGEPPVRASIAIEESGGAHSHGTEAGQDEGAAHTHETEETPGPGEVEVPRSLQSTVGLLTGLLVDRLGITSGPLAVIGSADLEFAGFAIVGIFVVSWVVALAIWRFGRIEERWGTQT